MSSESEEGVKKLVTVLATSTPMTVAREETIGENLGSIFARVPCICYPINFEKKSVLALLDSSSEVNAVYPVFAKELGLSIRPTDIGAQKIDGTTLETYDMVVAVFSMEDKANRVRFFEKTFLVANISPEVVLEMPFFILSSADVDFLGHKLRWRTFTTKEALSTTRRVDLVSKKEFATAVLDSEHETHVVYVGLVNSDMSLSSSLFELDVYPFRSP